MALREIASPAAVGDLLSNHANVVLTFSAHWCGPCKASKPNLEALAAQYASNPTLDVTFAIVYEDVLGDRIHAYGIRAFPTYVLFQNSQEVARVEGVNLPGIEAMIAQAGCQTTTGGETLGGGSTPMSPAEARAARLAKLGAAAPPAAAPEPVQPEEAAAPMDVEDIPAGDEEMKEAAVEDPVAKLDAEAIQTLTESMGFSLLRAQKGLLYGTGGTVEGAVEWLMQHQDDDDIDEPIPAGGGLKAQSYKCNDCGKILSNMANLELHANKTGHSDFEESTQHVQPLTEEEKAAKIAEIKELLKAKRAEREEEEKVDEVEREKQRRFMAKEMTKTREQLDIEQRKRDVMLRRKEKEAFKRERDRIRAELAKDKAERQANKGKLSSKLGVDGYNPDGIQYDVDDGTAEEQVDPEVRRKKVKADATKIDEYIAKVSGYKAGGDGGKCLKILKAYVGNVADNPSEEKYRSINMENKVFKTKVKPFVGAKSLLLAVGFKQNDSGDALVLAEDADQQLLIDTKGKLEAALAAYV